MAPSPVPPLLLLANYICHHIVVVLPLWSTLMLWVWELGRQDARVSPFDGCLKVSTLARSSLSETRNQKPRDLELACQP